MPEVPLSLDAKLDVFDENAKLAVRFLVDWLRDNGDDLIAVARGRHVQGHYLYHDANFIEYGQGRLLSEASEELADAIVYISRWLHNGGDEP